MVHNQGDDNHVDNHDCDGYDVHGNHYQGDDEDVDNHDCDGFDVHGSHNEGDDNHVDNHDCDSFKYNLFKTYLNEQKATLRLNM